MSDILRRRVSRRRALSSAAKAAVGAGVAAVIGWGAAGYFATQAARTVTKTVTVERTVTVGTTVKETVKPPMGGEPPKPDRLIVRTWGEPFDKALMDAVGKSFQDKYGIKIEFDYTEDNEIQPKLIQLVSAGKQPPIDVNWTTSVNAMREALWGLAIDLTPEDVPNLDGMKPVAKPEPIEGYAGWPFVNIYAYTTSLAYRTDQVDEPPKSWRELWDPKYEKSLGLYDDGFGFITVLAKLAGLKLPDDLTDPAKMEPVWDLLRDLKPNIGGLGEDPDHFNWLLTGQFKFVATLTANAFAAKSEGAPVAWTVPEEGVDMQTDALYVLRNLPPEREYWAKKLVNEALTPEAQTRLAEFLGLPTLHKEADYPDWMDEDPASPTKPEDFEKMIIIPIRVRVEHENYWFEKFVEIVSE